MKDEPTDDPPLVLQATEEPPVPAKPRPGILEAILWCVVFLATQLAATLFVVVVAFLAMAMQSPAPNQFLKQELDAAKLKGESGGGEPAVPSALSRALAWGMLAAPASSVGLIAIVLPWRIGKGWKRQIGVRTPSAVHLLLVVLVAPGFLLLADGLALLVKDHLGLAPPDIGKLFETSFSTFPWFLTFLAIGLGPGFVEEIWCRGFIGRGLSARYGLPVGVIITSLLFALLHCNLAYAVFAPFMGAYLHLVYLAGRSIWLSITLHTLNNSIGVFAMLSGAGEHIDPAAQGLVIPIYLAAAALVLSASFALWTSRTRVVAVAGGAEAPLPDWQPEYPGISAPPPGSGYRLERGRVNRVAGIATVVSFGALIVLLVI